MPMRTAYHEQLSGLGARLAEMCGLAAKALDDATRALLEADLTLAEQVIAEHGVIDPYQRVYNYPTLSVHDGASISANLGVNPSLSITAQAERAASLWPNKGEVDQRPAQGEPYKRLAPIAPNHPVVPVDAPAALRHLPIEPVSSAG